MSGRQIHTGETLPRGNATVREESTRRNVFETTSKQNSMPVENHRMFAGEAVSMFSFFLMFPNIVFFTKGSGMSMSNHILKYMYFNLQ